MIEMQIDDFLNIISEAGILFKKGLENYLKDNTNEFEKRLNAVSEHERKADELRLNIEKQLYMHTLIPESRGDVLAILENTDRVIDDIKEALQVFAIERPEIPEKFDALIIELADSSIEAVESLIQSVRAFFKDISSVNDHIYKVKFYEREADKIALSLKNEIFKADIPLSRKMHLRFCAQQIEKISDSAEDMSERLAIYTIKRQI
jgi:predicted phosphate transport protein (TIGR00153 family)